MMKRRILPAALALALVPLLASSTQAQEFSARYTKRFDNSRFSVSVGRGASSGRRVSASYGRSPLRPAAYSGRGYAPARLWIPGGYEVVPRQVWVPGFSEKVWVEPVFDVTCDRFGNQVRVLVRDGYYRTVHHPGHYEVRQDRVWQPGHWRCR